MKKKSRGKLDGEKKREPDQKKVLIAPQVRLTLKNKWLITRYKTLSSDFHLTGVLVKLVR